MDEQEKLEMVKGQIQTFSNLFVMGLAPFLDQLPLTEALVMLKRIQDQLQGEAEYLIDRTASVEADEEGQ